MASSAALASPAPLAAPPPPTPSVQGPINVDSDGDVEMEYEEIEVEEEIEIEEEDNEEEQAVEEAEAGDNESEVGEVLTPERERNQENGDKTSKNNDPKACSYNSRKVNVIETPVVRDIATSPRTLNASEQTGKVLIDTSAVRDVTFASETTGASKKIANETAPSVSGTNFATSVAVQDINQFEPRSFRSPRMRLRDLPSISEFEGMNKKLRIACEFHAKGWCIKGNSCRFLHIDSGCDIAAKASEVSDRQVQPSSSTYIPSQQSWGKPNLESQISRFVDHKKDRLGSTSIPVNGESSGLNLHSNSHVYYAAPPAEGVVMCRNSIYGGYFSRHSIVPNDNSNMKISSVGTSEGMILKESNLMHNEDGFAESPYSRSKHASSSWNNHVGVSSNLLESSLKPQAPPSSSKPSNPRVPGSEAEKLSRNHPFTDTEQKMDETKVIFDDWEPSVPFRPSHFITRNLLSKVSLYDPVRDCVVLNHVKEGHVKFSSSDQGSTVRNVCPESHSSQDEVKHLNASHVGDAVENKILDSSYDNKLKAENQRRGPYPKVGESGKTNEIAVDNVRDEHNEAKAFKYFHSALIEYVKDLVKPTWRQGLMSKDAHKVVVKRSVDKVLSSIQNDQFPGTPELVKLYLSSSHEKLARLVEAYIEKYGKC